MKHFSVFLCLLLFLAACDNDKTTETLAIITANGEINYQVETAQTPEELKTGLMYRDFLAADSGMIFLLNPPQQAIMWMKNTLIPLDMLFIDENGKITWIYENAPPLSEKYIISPLPSKAVLELNGGDAKKHNIKVGDTVKYRFFNNI